MNKRAFKLLFAGLFLAGLGLQAIDAHAYRLLKRIRFNAGVPIDFLGSNTTESESIILHDPLKQSFPDTDLVVYAAFRTTDVPVSAEVFYRRAGLSDLTYSTTPFVNFSRVDISQVPIASAKGSALNLLKAAGDTFVYVATAKIPLDVVKIPGAEYYFRISDGTRFYYFRSSTAPQQVDVKNEFCYYDRIPAAGGLPGNPKGALAAGLSSLTIFPGAVGNDFDLSVCIKYPKMLAPSMKPAGNPVIRDDRAQALLTVTPDRMKLTKAANLVTAYNDFDGDGIVDNTNIPATDLKLFWWDGFGWRYVGGKADVQNRRVVASISQFSDYALFAASPDASRIFPKEKIITPATADGINDVAHFDGLADENVTIKIFDVTGRLVRTLNNLIIWDGRSDSGNIVENGVYIYQIYLENGTYSGVIAVAK